MFRIKTRVDRVQPRILRRTGVAVIGSTVLLIGLIMLALPGPGSLVILAGLAILALEFQWALRCLRRTQALTQFVVARVSPQRLLRHTAAVASRCWR